MPSIGAPEMIFILVIVLLIFGAGRLPEVGRSMGKAITEFKQGLSGSEDKQTLPNAAPQPPALPSDRGDTGTRTSA
jgi:sec-independent protein translocase protein TatA